MRRCSNAGGTQERSDALHRPLRFCSDASSMTRRVLSSCERDSIKLLAFKCKVMFSITKNGHDYFKFIEKLLVLLLHVCWLHITASQLISCTLLPPVVITI